MTMPPPRDENPCRPRHFKPAPCAPAPLDGPAKQSLDTSHTRLLITGGAVLPRLRRRSACASSTWRLSSAAIRAWRIAASRRKPTASRADIVDRNGVLLATTLETPSLYRRSRSRSSTPRDAARQLARVLPDLNESEVYAKLTSDKSFVWIKRQLTPRQQYEVNRLGIPGLQFEDEEKRVYPKGSLAAHVVGFAGIDNNGLAGVERGLDDVAAQRRRAGRSSRSTCACSSSCATRSPIRSPISTPSAASASSWTCAPARSWRWSRCRISIPTSPAPHRPRRCSTARRSGPTRWARCSRSSTRRWRSTTHVTTMTSGYDATNPIHIGRFTIHDDHAQRRWLTRAGDLHVFLEHRRGQDGGRRRQRPAARLPRPARPAAGAAGSSSRARRAARAAPWRPINTMTIGFGHGISVSPLQLATAVERDGQWRHPASARRS